MATNTSSGTARAAKRAKAVSLNDAIAALMLQALQRRGPDAHAAVSEVVQAGGAYQVYLQRERLALPDDEVQGWLVAAAARGNSGSVARNALRDTAVSDLHGLASLDHGDPEEGLDIDAAQSFIEDAMTDAVRVDPVPGKVVIRSVGDPDSKDGKDLGRRFKDVAEKVLAFAGRTPGIGEVRSAILSRWPWAVSAAEQIETHMAVLRTAGDPDIRIRPLLFVGDPGCGKTSIARFLADLLVLPSTVIPCGGVADSGGLASVARGWSTARPSAVANAFQQFRVANPVLILDEIDKSTKVGSHNGSLQGSLLSMMSTNAFQDSCLMTDVDTTSVTFIATANTLKELDPALVERFQVIRVDSPDERHFGVLLGNAKGDFLEENRLREWDLPLLGHDDVAVLRRYLSRMRSARSFRQAFDVVAKGLISEAERTPMVGLRH